MEWLKNFITEEPFSVIIPIVIIIFTFAYAARRAQIKHIARIKEINERYVQQDGSSADS